MVSRRQFVSDCCTAVASIAVAPLSLGRAPATAAPAPKRLDYAAFAAQLHTVFRVRLASSETVDLRLVKARPMPPPRLAPGRRPPPDADHERFSLIFSGPVEAPLPSAIHAVEHAQLGHFEMHLGEIGQREGARVRYEAVFNQPAGRGLSPRV